MVILRRIPFFAVAITAYIAKKWRKKTSGLLNSQGSP